MDYLAKYSLRYSSYSADQGRRAIVESPERFFKAEHDVEAVETANRLKREILDETASRKEVGQIYIKLEKLLQVIDIKLR